MINVGENYLYVQDLLSKNNGVYISPEEYERYGNAASREMQDDFLGMKTTPRIVIGKNRLVDSRMLPYKKKVTLNFTNEILEKPEKCKYISAVYSKVGKIPVRPLDDDRQAKIFDDPFADPGDQDKYYTEENTQLTLLGDDSLQVVVEYYEEHTPIVYAYTRVSGRAVYNDANSTHYVWNASEEEELTNRILAKAGLSMKDSMQIQVAQNNKAQE